MKQCASELIEIKEALQKKRLDLLPRIPSFRAFILMDFPESRKGLSALILKDLLTQYNYSIDSLETEFQERLADFLGLEVSELKLSQSDEQFLDEQKKRHDFLKDIYKGIKVCLMLVFQEKLEEAMVATCSFAKLISELEDKATTLMFRNFCHYLYIALSVLAKEKFVSKCKENDLDEAMRTLKILTFFFTCREMRKFPDDLRNDIVRSMEKVQTYFEHGRYELKKEFEKYVDVLTWLDADSFEEILPEIDALEKKIDLFRTQNKTLVEVNLKYVYEKTQEYFRNNMSEKDLQTAQQG